MDVGNCYIIPNKAVLISDRTHLLHSSIIVNN